jgi:type VI protein secretion system component VasF
VIDEEGDDLSDGRASIGLLMEIARTHQELAGATLARLREHTAGLDVVVREQIRRTLIDELRGVHLECQRAVESLRRVHRAADLRILWWSVLIAALSAAVAAMVGYETAHIWRELTRLSMQFHK